MALNPTDSSQKTLANLEGTSDAKRLVEELGADTINVYGPDVWTDNIDPTPATAVGLGVAVQETLLTMVEDVTVANQEAWRAGAFTDFIGTKFGPLYDAQFFDGNDALITKAQQIAQGFNFNYQTGILTIDGNAGAFVQPFKISAYRYVGQKGQFGGAGGQPNDWRVEATVAARDAIPVGERQAGMRVRVLSRSVVYELEDDLATWNVAEKGNPALVSLLTGVADGIQRFVNSDAGDDEAGDGLTPGTAWQTMQRAVDELPGQGVGGLYLVTCAGAADQEAPDFSHLQAARGALFLYFEADFSSSVDTISILSNNGRIANPTDPNGGDFHSVLDHACTPWTTPVDEEIHFLYQGQNFGYGFDFPQTTAVVGTSGGGTTHESNEATGNLLLLTPFARSAGSYELVAWSQKIVRRSSDFQLIMDNPAVDDAIFIDFYGFIFEDATNISLADIGLHSCRMDGLTLLSGGGFHEGVVYTTQSDHSITNPRGVSFGAIVANGALFINPSSVGSSVGALGPLLMRSRRVGDARKLVLGARDTPTLTINNLDRADFVGTASSSLGSIAWNNARARMSDSSGCAVENNQATFIAADHNSWVYPIGRLYGETSGVCITLGDGSTGFSMAALDTRLTSALGATSELQLKAGGPTISWTDLPASDIVEMTRAE